MKLNNIFLKYFPKGTVLTIESVCLGIGFMKEEQNIF